MRKGVSLGISPWAACGKHQRGRTRIRVDSQCVLDGTLQCIDKYRDETLIITRFLEVRRAQVLASPPYMPSRHLIR